MKKVSTIRIEMRKALEKMIELEGDPVWAHYYTQGVASALIWALSEKGVFSPMKQLEVEIIKSPESMK